MTPQWLRPVHVSRTAGPGFNQGGVDGTRTRGLRRDRQPVL